MEKKDTLYFMFKVDVGSASVQQAREYAAAVSRMVNDKQKPDDQYTEKWFILPVRDEGTSIELIYPPTDYAKEQLEKRYNEMYNDIGSFVHKEHRASEFELSRDELTRRYLAKVEEICEDIDWKTSFGPEEICSLIYDIIHDARDKKDGEWYPVIYCGITNNNNRRYEVEEIRKQMDKLKERAEAKILLGQISYPINPLTNTLEDVNLRDVSHSITDVLLQDGILWAKIHVLDTPAGKELKVLMEQDAVVFRPVCDGTIETIGETNYVRIKDFRGIHAVSVQEDAFNV